MAMETIDCVVVGGGCYGLAAAKQFSSVNPNLSLVVFDAQDTLGGTWADQRLYPKLKTNNLFGTYEFPDFPMTSAQFGVKPGQYIPGDVVNKYVNAYADKFGITSRIRLRTKVLTAEHHDTAEGGWTLTVAGPDGEYKVFARRLIIATGLTSEAFLPHFDGQETFGGSIFHGKHFQQHSDTLNTAKAVTVFGGSKYAWDAVYAYATSGVKVHWVIRSSGYGPCWMTPSLVTPLKKWIEKLVNTRSLSWFSPCVWGDADGYAKTRSRLHGTSIGRAIVNAFWNILGGDVEKLMRYDTHPKLQLLKPWYPAFFAGPSFSIMNFDQDFLEVVKGDLVDIHIGEIVHLSPGKVHLADGKEFESDVLLAHTGWKHVPPMKFLPEGIEKELGIPHKPTEAPSKEDLANQKSLVERADKEILQRFPRLKDQPVWKNYVPLTEQKGIDSNDEVTICTPTTPWNLYHFMVPPSERFLRPRDTAFIGMVSNFSNILTAHLQGLWVGAYFAGRLANDPSTSLSDSQAMEKLQYETVLHNRFGHWRHPRDWGYKTPSFVFDAVPYFDLLQRDLGLNPHRKRGVFAELFDPYGPEDYRNVNQEWSKKFMKQTV